MRRLLEGASLVCLVTLLVLGGGTGVALAGHSFDDPMYTTGDGDFYVLGGLDVDGTCQLDGAVTFTAGMTGDALTLSGALTVGGAVAVTDSIYAGTNLTVADTLKVEGVLKGARVFSPFTASDDNATADFYLRCGWLLCTSSRGAPMPVSGSIVGYAVRYNVDTATDGHSLIEVDINGVRALADSLDSSAGTGWYDNTQRYARDSITFAAGDYITAEWDEVGTFQIDTPAITLDLQLDD